MARVKKKINLTKWASVHKSKKDGGLGFKSLKLMNESFDMEMFMGSI